MNTGYGWTRLFGLECNLPLRVWLRRVWKAVMHDCCEDLAAQMSYFFLVALFPFFIVLAAIVGYLPFTGAWPHVLTWITQYFPDPVQPYVFRTVTNLTQEWGGLLSFGLASSIWIATRAVISLMDGLNTAYNARETRGFWKRRLLACGVMLVFALTFLTAFGLLAFGGRVGHWMGTQSGAGLAFVVLWHVLRWVDSADAAEFCRVLCQLRAAQRQTPLAMGNTGQPVCGGGVVSIDDWLQRFYPPLHHGGRVWRGGHLLRAHDLGLHHQLHPAGGG